MLSVFWLQEQYSMGEHWCNQDTFDPTRFYSWLQGLDTPWWGTINWQHMRNNVNEEVHDADEDDDEDPGDHGMMHEGDLENDNGDHAGSGGPRIWI